MAVEDAGAAMFEGQLSKRWSWKKGIPEDDQPSIYVKEEPAVRALLQIENGGKVPHSIGQPSTQGLIFVVMLNPRYTVLGINGC